MELYAKIKAAVKKLKENPTEYNRDALLILLAECICDVLLTDK